MKLKESIESSNMLNCKGDNVYLLCYDYEISPFIKWLVSYTDDEEERKLNYINFSLHGNCIYLNPSDESVMYSTSDNSFSDKKSQEFSLFYDPQNIEMYDEETIDKYGIQKIVDESGRKNVVILKVPKAMIGAKECGNELFPMLISERTDFQKYYTPEIYDYPNIKFDELDKLERDYTKKYGKLVTTINSRFVYGVQREITGKVVLNPFYNFHNGCYATKYSVEQQKYLNEHGNAGIINKTNGYVWDICKTGLSIKNKQTSYNLDAEKYSEITKFYYALYTRTLEKYMPKSKITSHELYIKSYSELDNYVNKLAKENKAKNGSDGQEMI